MASSSPSRFGLTFGHPLNLLLLASAGASALMTGSWLPLAVGAGAEVLWFAVGSRLGGFPDYIEHRQRTALVASREAAQPAGLTQVSETDRRRYLELETLRGDIRRLVEKSDTLEQDLLEPELAKVDRLVTSFLELAARVATYAAFVEEHDLDALESEVRKQERVLERAENSEDRSIGAQNLDLMEARLQRSAEVRKLLKSARGQLNLIENTLQLMRDQIASLQTPENLTERLDDLVRSVAAVEASARETRAVEAQARAVGIGP